MFRTVFVKLIFKLILRLCWLWCTLFPKYNWETLKCLFNKDDKRKKKNTFLRLPLFGHQPREQVRYCLEMIKNCGLCRVKTFVFIWNTLQIDPVEIPTYFFLQLRQLESMCIWQTSSHQISDLTFIHTEGCLLHVSSVYQLLDKHQQSHQS